MHAVHRPHQQALEHQAGIVATAMAPSPSLQGTLAKRLAATRQRRPCRPSNHAVTKAPDEFCAEGDETP